MAGLISTQRAPGSTVEGGPRGKHTVCKEASTLGVERRVTKYLGPQRVQGTDTRASAVDNLREVGVVAVRHGAEVLVHRDNGQAMTLEGGIRKHNMNASLELTPPQ